MMKAITDPFVGSGALTLAEPGLKFARIVEPEA
jgi:site-specific DNA-adenine methylase